jgi:serine/threonine protein kinase
MAPLGSHLEEALAAHAQSHGSGRAVDSCLTDLRDQLRDFKSEGRLLIQLAATGRVVVEVQRTLDTAVEILNLRGTPTDLLWRNTFQMERDAWMEDCTALLMSTGSLRLAMGDWDQRVEVLTLLRDGVDRYSAVLTPDELDVMSAAFDAVVESSGVVVARLPSWFATSKREWFGANVSAFSGNEERCLREVGIWTELHHPNVRKLYGACHVGKAFVIHEWSGPVDIWWSTWKKFAEVARGLEYVHDRGLVHQDFSALLQSTETRGILSGVGLVRQKEGHRGKIDRQSSRKRRDPSVSEDIRALGLAIFNLLAKWRKPARSRLPAFVRETASRLLSPLTPSGLPLLRPDFITRSEWSLLTQLCAVDRTRGMQVKEVIYRMSSLALESKHPSALLSGVLALQTNESESKDADERPPESTVTVADLGAFMISTLGQTLRDTLDEAAQLSEELEELSEVNGSVLARLNDVFSQLDAVPDPLPAAVVEDYSLILIRFHGSLDRWLYGSDSSVASTCASRSIANKNYGIHYDIDRLLQSSPLLQRSAAVHSWQPSFQKAQKDRLQALEMSLTDPLSVVSDLDTELAKAEAVALLQFEAHSLASELETDAIDCASRDRSPTGLLPRWFIPPYQVELGRLIAAGSFGAAYEGKWLGADVVVKLVSTDQTDAENQKQFLREADLWFSLTDPHLVKLYGACHVGQPFFVCEHAVLGTAFEVQKTTPQNPWLLLWGAAQGLQHLHEHGIVHGDIKGNNIVAGLREVKLCDFGLSSLTSNLKDELTHGEVEALGAIRWKAPECLLGTHPTFASDIYSLGMCIIEAVTGQYPWGNSILDTVVKFKVTEERQLPPRPQNFRDAQWELVTRMCCFEAEKRMKVAAVVKVLYDFF